MHPNDSVTALVLYPESRMLKIHKEAGTTVFYFIEGIVLHGTGLSERRSQVDIYPEVVSVVRYHDGKPRNSWRSNGVFV